MNPKPIIYLSLLTALSLTSCVDPGDLSYGPGNSYGSGYGYGQGYSSVNVGYRQYNTLPLGYVGDAYLYGGRYYSGGLYQTGSFQNQGRSYNNRYFHNGQYYYGGNHQHHDNRSHVSVPTPRTHVSVAPHISVPTPYSRIRTPVRSAHSFRR